MIILALALAAADAPSFDCAKAATRVEKMICADSELAAVDRAVAKLYAGVSRADRKKLFTSQADWLKERDRCEDRGCLLGSYDERFFDLFGASRTPTLDYESAESNGTLSILEAGDGWYAFQVVGLWIGSNPGQVNDTMEYGHFKLINGKAEEPPGEGCGWRIQRLSRDRWQFTELMPDDPDMIGCGGLNATATGVYSR
jgi:hypothetical protein